MVQNQKKIILAPSIVGAIFYFCVVLFARSQTDPTVLDSFIFDISATCSPQATVQGPENISISFTYALSESQPSFYAYLNSPSTFETYPSIINLWSFPDEGWISAIIEGPRFESHYYCQEPEENKKLHFSYFPTASHKIGLSKDGATTQKELDTIGGKQQSWVHLKHETLDQNNVYRAGRGTKSLYWFQFSIPIHPEISTTHTIIKYEIL